jgi:hypothetical protein
MTIYSSSNVAGFRLLSQARTTDGRLLAPILGKIRRESSFSHLEHEIMLKQSKGCDDSCLLAVLRGNGYLRKALTRSILLKMVQPSMLAERSIM